MGSIIIANNASSQDPQICCVTDCELQIVLEDDSPVQIYMYDEQVEKICVDAVDC